MHQPYDDTLALFEAELTPPPAAPEKGIRIRSLLSLSLGILIVLFFLYEFGGSHLIHARSQELLLQGFKASLDAEKVKPIVAGDPVGILSIPGIDLEIAIIEGTTPSHLEQGIGHFRSTPHPGQVGNVVLAGRRTTFGAPLRRIEELDEGDVIEVSTRRGIFEYVVFENRVVKPGEPDAVTATDDDRLTLVTSHPAYAASGRRVVSAELDGDPIATPAIAGPVIMERNEMGLSGDPSAIGELIVWLEVLAFVLLLGAYAYRRGAPRAMYTLSIPIVLLVLFFVFDQLGRLLPATL